MHPRSRFVALGVSLHPTFARETVIVNDDGDDHFLRMSPKIFQSHARSRLALQPFLLRGDIFPLGSLHTSTIRLRSRERETQAHAALAGRVPRHVHHRRADRECSARCRHCLVLI
jgi:hypothetical protein